MNNKIDWKRKLSSRKLWAAIAGFVGPLLLAFGVSQDTVTQVAGIIMSGASIVIYILGEGLIDAARETNSEHYQEQEDNINE